MKIAVRRFFSIVLLCAASCSKPEPHQTSVGQGGNAAPVLSTQPAAPLPTPVAPKDLESQALQRDLGCEKAGHPKACRMLKDFALAQRFTARTPSGEGRWIGPAMVVERGIETTRHLVLWCKTVPTSQISPGDLPVKCGFELLPEGLKLQSEKLMRALTRAADPPESNPAYQRAHGFVAKEPRTLANTAGPSVHMTAERSVFLRFAPLRKVYLVSPAGTDAPSGDGIYAELWLGDW
jgi:hypothetical protein